MTPGLGAGEYAARQNSQSVEQIISRGLNAPYHLVQLSFMSLISSDIWSLRLASVFFSIIIFTFMFLLLRSWFGLTIAVFSTLIFLATPWIVNSVRTGTPNILLLWLIVPLACFFLLDRSNQKAWAWWIILCITVGLGLYVPGFFWLLLLGAILSGRPILRTLRRISGLLLGTGIALAILIVVPLVISLALEPSRIRQYLLFPDSLRSVMDLIKSIGWAVSSLFWSTKSQIDIGISRLPVLNILQIVLVIFGFYALAAKARNITYILSGLLIFAILAAGVNNQPHYLIFGLPAVAVLIGAGLRYLYIEWRRVFPLNPFAYALAIALIALVVGTHILYGVRYSLIAWPQTTETKSTYVLK